MNKSYAPTQLLIPKECLHLTLSRNSEKLKRTENDSLPDT